jgi:SSS family transporter
MTEHIHFGHILMKYMNGSVWFAKKWMRLLMLIVVFFIPRLTFSQIQHQLKWNALPSIPDKEGFAGMFAGVSDEYLICMGGANFPDGMPWKGGKKVWYDDIFVLSKKDQTWRPVNKKLPRPLAYGVSVTYRNKIILVGGNNSEGYYSDVYSVEYSRGEIQIDTLPSLPCPIANMTGALVGNTIFIAGGDTSFTGIPVRVFLALDLLNGSATRKWITLEPWPGPPRIQAVSASLRDHYFIFSGINLLRTPEAGNERIVLKDAYQFIPAFNGSTVTGGKWTILPEMPRGVAAGASPAPVFGTDHVLFPGGLDSATAAYPDPSTFPGFVTDLLCYNAESNTWLNMGNLPGKSTRVTLPAVKWDHQWILLNGETAPGKRSPEVFTLSKNLQFGWVNWIALFLYFTVVLWIGFMFSRKGHTSQDFFTAGGQIPSWAAGLSIFGSQISAITFMATPAIVFATDWSLAIGSVMILAVVPIVIKFYVPFFRRLNVVSAYEYLEHRFSKNVRTLGSISFILFQLGRMGIVLFLPSVAIASITGMNIYACIAVIGVVCTVYTFLGGIEAVIWTDVLQVIILMGGAVLCLFIAAANIDGGFGAVIHQGLKDGKFTLFHTGWSPDRLVLWVAIVGFFFLNIIPYTSDQTIVQKYLTVKDEEATRKSLWTNSLLSLLTIPVFFGLGTILFIFYKSNPAKIPSEEIGQILPDFIVQELPIGLAGLVIAGIFAASQSALSSSLNSIATSYISDIYCRFYPEISDRSKLKLAKQITILMGMLGMAIAAAIAILNIEFIFDLFQEVLGIVAGSLAGVFILGIFTKRANSYGVFMGIIVSVFVVFIMKSRTGISLYLYGAISVVTCVVVGYITSTLFPKGKKNLQGLTYWTLKKGNRK